MKTVLRILFLLLAVTASSCVVFPTRLADDTPYGSQSIDFIVLDETSRIEVSATLGAPVRVFSNGRWWLYQSDRRLTEWFLLIGTGGDIFGGGVAIYSLVVEFSDADFVKNLTVVTDQHPCKVDETICYDDGRLTVVQDTPAIARTFPDESSNAPVTDSQLQALRGEETDRFSATLDSGEQVELVERRGLSFDARSMKPFTGHISMFDGDGVRRAERSYDSGKLEGVETIWHRNGEKAYRAHYKNNLLHGPYVVWEQDGSINFEACYEDGTLIATWKDKCQR